MDIQNKKIPEGIFQQMRQQRDVLRLLGKRACNLCLLLHENSSRLFLFFYIVPNLIIVYNEKESKPFRIPCIGVLFPGGYLLWYVMTFLPRSNSGAAR